ncbi:MAG: transposase [Anaerolineae bacterium]|nr:transposase [Anaerolineae bacterium]
MSAWMTAWRSRTKATRHLEGIDWHHDHTESWAKHQVYKNSLVFLALRVHVGPFSFTVDIRPYLREKTVRRLNRKRPQNKRLKFRSKVSLARMVLADLVPLIPDEYQVCVLFDSWHAAARIIKWCRQRNWHVICALRSNRGLNGQKLSVHNRRLRHKRYERATLTAADHKCTYLVRSLTGALADVPGAVRVFISKRHPSDKKPRYFMTTDLSLSARCALTWYQKRWPCEVVFFYLKTRLGLGDFRRQFPAFCPLLAKLQLIIFYTTFMTV